MKTANPIRFHHADESSVEEIKDAILQDWSSSEQGQHSCLLLLRLGYRIQD